ncbi:MAG: class I SAM-dependent methyltransferase [archaeon]|nr:class I SAM-dependent methyltransferase [archaeon]
MDEHEFARSLLAHERKEWQDPEKIISQIDVRKGISVADLACGPGFFIVPLARVVGKGGRIYAVDKSQVMLEYLKSNMQRSKTDPEIVKIIESDVSKTPIPSASCDLVLFANILHDLDDQKEFLAEVRRISKPSATIVDIDWKDTDNGFGPPLEIRMAEEKARKILERNGLTCVASLDPGPYHYGLIMKLQKDLK